MTHSGAARPGEGDGQAAAPEEQDQDAVKPRLRGWLHELTFPLSLTAGIALIVASPTGVARVATSIYTITSSLLFGVSAIYHRGHWRLRVRQLLRRLDHANVYLMIAGSYTPIAALALRGATRALVLAIVWAGAASGVAFRLLWTGAPRWLYTPLYIVLGWVAVAVMPELLKGAGLPAFVLILTGGALYTLGGLVYGLRWPNPSPRWFGFHEVFHTFTVLAYGAQFSAVALILYGLARHPVLRG